MTRLERDEVTEQRRQLAGGFPGWRRQREERARRRRCWGIY